MVKVYKSGALAAIHEMMEGFHQCGAIDKQTMREFDDGCLTAVEALDPQEVRSIREREHISQPVFARYLNVSKGLVSGKPPVKLSITHKSLTPLEILNKEMLNRMNRL